jgi:hypothetical protein
MAMALAAVGCLPPPAQRAPAVRAADLRLDGKFDDPTLRADVLAVCRDVLAVFETHLGEPPLGTKPIVVRQAPDGEPRACLNGLPREYGINITCLRTRYYCQITYQFGHELGHVWQDPNCSGWFAESVATAMSHVCLAELGEKWKTSPPFPNWADYAPHFVTYRADTVRDQLKRLEVPSPDKADAWLREHLAARIRDGKVDRPEQAACAVVIERALRKHPKAWGALTRLGAITKDGRVDFARWHQLVADAERPLVRELADFFAPLQAAAGPPAPPKAPPPASARPARDSAALAPGANAP